MKMILVAADGGFASALSYHLKPLGFTLEHFKDPRAPGWGIRSTKWTRRPFFFTKGISRGTGSRYIA